MSFHSRANCGRALLAVVAAVATSFVQRFHSTPRILLRPFRATVKSGHIGLVGDDAGAFEIDGLELFLRSGVTLDFETKQFFSVTVSVGDANVPDSWPVHSGFTLAIVDVAEIQRPRMRPATTIRFDASIVGPQAIVLTHADLAAAAITDPTTTGLVVKSIASGRVEKWNGTQWVDVAKPATGSPQELLRQLSLRLIRPGDRIRWVPAAAPGRLTDAFALLGWDGMSMSEDESEVLFERLS